MNEKNKFLIIMPLYNREKWLAKALDSLFMQEVNFPYTILIIDDCSTDKSLEIAKSYQEKHGNIEIIENKENLKLLRTIFKAYDRLKDYAYFCVLDPDDYWICPHKMQEAVDFLEKNKEYTIYATNIEVLEENGKKSKFIHTDKTGIRSTYEDYLAGRAVYVSCTQGSIFRNVIFNNGLPKDIAKLLDSPYPEAFRADSFRNFLHLEKGAAYFENKFTAVYNTTSDGLWTNLDKRRQILLNTQSSFAFSLYFKDKKEFYLGMALWQINPQLESFIERLKKEKLNIEDILLYQEFSTVYQEIVEALTENNMAEYEAKMREGKLKSMLNTGAMFQKYLRIYLKKMENQGEKS